MAARKKLGKKKGVTVVDSLNVLISLIGAAKGDAEKFDRGNNAAGKRVRLAMQKVKQVAQDVRVLISEIKNSR